MSDLLPLPDWVADFLNRRSEVERILRRAAKEGRSIEPEEAKALANRLSVPDEVASS